MTQNRKRSRSFQDETEFMPLSKRINNLHINNMFTEPNNMTNPEWVQQATNNNNQSNNQNHRLSESPNGSEQNAEWNYSLTQYSPDLDEAQNPHYFNINKLLYEMYLQRINRTECHQI